MDTFLKYFQYRRLQIEQKDLKELEFQFFMEKIYGQSLTSKWKAAISKKGNLIKPKKTSKLNTQMLR